MKRLAALLGLLCLSCSSETQGRDPEISDPFPPPQAELSVRPVALVVDVEQGTVVGMVGVIQ